MPRRKKGQPPSYRLHKSSGQAVVTLPLGNGTSRDVLLGQYDTDESRAEYYRVLAEWNAGGYRPGRDSGSLSSIAELIERFMAHAEHHYRRPDGSQTDEVKNYVYAFRPLNFLYGSMPVSEFTPLKLKAVRALMIDGYVHPRYGTQKALARGVINQRVGRIVRLFKWGVGEEVVTGSVWQALRTVAGLQEGRSEARETEPTEPVAVEIVEKTLANLLPPVQAIIRLQLLTGMRSGEVGRMRACDIDASGEVWFYRPVAHKTRHKGKSRVVALGPKAQEVIRPWLKVACSGCNRLDKPALAEFEQGLCPECRDRRQRGTITLFKFPDTEDSGDYYLFSPAEAVEARDRKRRQSRKSKVQPSQRNRRKAKPKRKPREFYNASAIQHAVARAVKLAEVPHWHPHQLRHTRATQIRKQFGLEAAQVALGHSQASITQLYAERDLGLAVEVARKIG